MRVVVFAIILLLALVSLSASEHEPANGGLPIVQADYQRCVIIDNGPIRRPDGYTVHPNRKKWSIA